MSENGRDVSLSWPKPLPKPTLEGDSAVYPEVFPGVDLRVSASVDSFSHALIVKTREAAANPDLATLNFGLKGKGLTVRAEADGRLRAVDPSGQTVFGSAKPQMWDAGGEKAQQPASVPAVKTMRSADAPASASASGEGAPAAPAADATPPPRRRSRASPPAPSRPTWASGSPAPPSP